MKLKNFAATAAAALMAVSALGAPVFAADDGGETPTPSKVVETNVALTKQVEVAGNVKLTLIEETQFNFKAEAVKEGLTEANGSAVPGTEFKGRDGAITFSPAVLADNENTAYIDFTAAKMSVDLGKFTYPGTYVYKVSEVESNVNGIIDTDDYYILRLNIESDANGNLVVGPAKFSKNGDTNSKTDAPVFVNTLDTDPIYVTKKVAGTQGYTKEKFPFTITINGKKGQTFTATGNLSDGTKDEKVVEADNVPVIFNVELAHDETITIDGLTADDTYTVSETDSKGYTPSVLVTKDKADQKISLNVADGKATTDEITAMNKGTETIVFTNTKEGVIPTGLLMTAAPYVLIAGLGGIFAVMFFRKKRED